MYNYSIIYNQSAFSLNKASMPVNSEILWCPDEVPHCAGAATVEKVHSLYVYRDMRIYLSNNIFFIAF